MSDVEFGGMGVDQVLVGSWGSSWKKFKSVFKKAAKGAAESGMVKDALNSYSPGMGDAAEKGMQLVGAAKAGDSTALSQIKGIADAAKAGDTSKQGAHDMLTTINEARNEAKAEIATEIGKTYVVKDPKTGKKHKFKSKAEAQAWMKSQQPARRPGQQRPGQQPAQRPGQGPVQRPVNQQQVQQAIQRVPQQNRGALMQGILAQQQQNMQQGMPFGMDQYGMQSPYGFAQPQYGSPYGMQQPYGYGQQDYYPQDYGDPGYPPDYADTDMDFQDEPDMPDEGGQSGESPLAYQG